MTGNASSGHLRACMYHLYVLETIFDSALVEADHASGKLLRHVGGFQVITAQKACSIDMLSSVAVADGLNEAVTLIAAPET